MPASEISTTTATPALQPRKGAPRRVAIITTGRLNPAVSPAVASIVRGYANMAPEVGLVAYRHGFRGMLLGDLIPFGDAERAAVDYLMKSSGSPIGSSRARLTNAEHLKRIRVLRGKADPFDVAAAQLKVDKIDVLHVIGSSSSHAAAAELQARLAAQGYPLQIVGLPKTIENDMSPIGMTLGAQTAATAGAVFFENVVAEHNANPRMLIIHEIKGRAAGWLAARTAHAYRQRLATHEFAPTLGLERSQHEVHAVYTPEMAVDLESEGLRLRRVMDRIDSVNIFVAQGSFRAEIEREAKEAGKALPRHETIGYVRTEPAQWLAAKLKGPLRAEKVLVQRSGVFVRASAPGRSDVVLAQSLASAAVAAALDPAAPSGVVGHDTRRFGQLRLIPVSELAGAKPLDVYRERWVGDLLSAMGQPQDVPRVAAKL